MLTCCLGLSLQLSCQNAALRWPRCQHVLCVAPEPAGALTPLELMENDPASWQRWLSASIAPDPYKVARRVLPLVLANVIWSALLAVLRSRMHRWPRAPWLVHSLLGGVLGLLLAFRTNQAYERYWSACRSWTEIHAAVHSMMRTVSCYAGPDGRQSRGDRLLSGSVLRHLIAFPIALKQRFRRKFDVQEYLPILFMSECEGEPLPTVPGASSIC